MLQGLHCTLLRVPGMLAMLRYRIVPRNVMTAMDDGSVLTGLAVHGLSV